MVLTKKRTHPTARKNLRYNRSDAEEPEQASPHAFPPPEAARRKRRVPVTTTTPDFPTHPRVLLCEDEGLTIMMLQKALRAHGYQVVGQASTATEAIRIATSTPLDLILMDINLQGPMDGIEATRRIITDRFVPIIMLTALVDKVHVQRAFEAGACGYISKPVTSLNLMPMLSVILAQSPLAQRIEEAQRQFNIISGVNHFHSTPSIPDVPLV